MAANVGLICPCEYGEYYVTYLKKLNFDIRALWTPSLEVTVQFAAEHEIPFAANRPDEVLLRKEVEMIIITDRPSIHSQIAVKALGIGKHVLCDSPAALTNADAYKMVQAAQYYPQLLSLVGYGMRQLEVFRKAKSLVKDGFLGSPAVCEVVVRCGALFKTEFDWLWDYPMGGGVLNIVGSHVIDLISYIFDCKAVRVQGLVRSLRRTFKDEESFAGYCHRKLNAEDFASFLMKFDDDDISATVTLNSLCDGQFYQEIYLCGPEGQLCAKNVELYGRSKGSDEFGLIFKELDDDPVPFTAKVNNTCSAGGGGVPKFYADTFLKVCEKLSQILPSFVVNTPNNNNPDTNNSQKNNLAACATEIAGFEDAQYVRAVIDAVRHSSYKGDWVKVEMLSQEPQL